MPLTRTQKEEIIAEFKAFFTDSAVAIFLNFHGLSVKETMAMRRDFLAHGLRYRVAKKTLLAHAMHAAFGKELPALKGEIGVVFGSDVLEAAKGVVRAAKAMKALTVQGGWWEDVSASPRQAESVSARRGGWIDARQIVALAAIPSREVLIAQLVIMLNAPIRSTIGVLAGVPRMFVGVMEAIRKSKQ